MSQEEATSEARPPPVSRLMPPGSMTKRPREGSLDMESGLDIKKAKNEDLKPSNLTKSKSKSMMNIAGSSKPGLSSRTTIAARQKMTVPTRPDINRRQTTTALNDRTNRTTSR